MATVRHLRQSGHDPVHLLELGKERLPDADIMVLAHEEERIILTFDLDIGDIMAHSKRSLPSVIIFRIHDETPASVIPKLDEVLQVRRNVLEMGAIIIVEDSRHRIRRLPLAGFGEE